MNIINIHSEPTEIIMEVAFRKSADFKISRKTKVHRTAAQIEVSTKDCGCDECAVKSMPSSLHSSRQSSFEKGQIPIIFLYKKGRFFCMNVHGIRKKTRIPKGTNAAFLFRGPQGSFLASFLLKQQLQYPQDGCGC